MSSRLPRSFYARDTRVVSRELLGMRLVRLLPDGLKLSGLIVETEAYRPGDRAAHSYHGRDERNDAMFMRPGTAYVYLIHGVHHCLNLSTEDEGVGAAVLIRALEPVEGVEQMQHYRMAGSVKDKPFALHDLCGGPGRLCRALNIDLSFTGYDTLQADSRLYVEKGPGYSDDQVSTSPRIGVIGNELALTIEWRWFVTDNPFVSHQPRSRNLKPRSGHLI